MVSLAFLVLPGSPVEVVYWMPPTITKITATRPEIAMTALRIPRITLGSSPMESTLVQPEAALVSSDIWSLSQMLSLAKVGMGAKMEAPKIVATAAKLTNFLNFIILLCSFY